MSLHAFQLLSPVMQLYWLLHHGTFLTQRWEEETGGMNLYYLPDEGRGFFAEVGVDEARDCFIVLRSFSDSEALEGYAHGVRLPGE